MQIICYFAKIKLIHGERYHEILYSLFYVYTPSIYKFMNLVSQVNNYYYLKEPTISSKFRSKFTFISLSLREERGERSNKKNSFVIVYR